MITQKHIDEWYDQEVQNELRVYFMGCISDTKENALGRLMKGLDMLQHVRDSVPLAVMKYKERYPKTVEWFQEEGVK